MDRDARVATIGGTLLAMLVGIAVGLFIASDTETADTATELGPEPATRADLERVVDALENLGARVDALALDVSRPIVPPSSPEPIEPATSWRETDTLEIDDETLPAELVRWMKGFERRMALTGGAVSADRLRIPSPGYAPNPPPLPLADESESEGLSRDHFSWTYQDVLDIYGLPDTVHTDSDNIEWEYKYTDPSRPEGLDDVHFVFINGLCMRVFAH